MNSKEQRPLLSYITGIEIRTKGDSDGCPLADIVLRSGVSETLRHIPSLQLKPASTDYSTIVKAGDAQRFTHEIVINTAYTDLYGRKTQIFIRLNFSINLGSLSKRDELLLASMLMPRARWLTSPTKFEQYDLHLLRQYKDILPVEDQEQLPFDYLIYQRPPLELPAKSELALTEMQKAALKQLLPSINASFDWETGKMIRAIIPTFGHYCIGNTSYSIDPPLPHLSQTEWTLAELTALCA